MKQVTCEQCGYKYSADNVDEACPICNATRTAIANSRADMLEQSILNHILRGFKDFGIEYTLEIINREMDGQSREVYRQIISKYFKGLKLCFKK
jgi:hypothetical protein